MLFAYLLFTIHVNLTSLASLTVLLSNLIPVINFMYNNSVLFLFDRKWRDSVGMSIIKYCIHQSRDRLFLDPEVTKFSRHSRPLFSHPYEFKN